MYIRAKKLNYLWVSWTIADCSIDVINALTSPNLVNMFRSIPRYISHSGTVPAFLRSKMSQIEKLVRLNRLEQAFESSRRHHPSERFHVR